MRRQRGASLIRNTPLVGPYKRTLVLWWSWGGGAVSYERGTSVVGPGSVSKPLTQVGKTVCTAPTPAEAWSQRDFPCGSTPAVSSLLLPAAKSTLRSFLFLLRPPILPRVVALIPTASEASCKRWPKPPTSALSQPPEGRRDV
jgi:hypothetical protein